MDGLLFAPNRGPGEASFVIGAPCATSIASHARCRRPAECSSQRTSTADRFLVQVALDFDEAVADVVG